MSEPLSNDERVESPTCMLLWFRTPGNPVTGDSEAPRLQQRWQIHQMTTAGVVKTHEEWRDVPEESWYGY